MTREPELRLISLEALIMIVEKKQYSHNILNMLNDKYAYLKKEDRAFISRLVHGTLDYLLQIDYIISLYSKVTIKKMKPFIRNILRISIYQILYMDRVPDSAACNEAVKIVSKKGFFGLKSFVNAILRAVARDKEKLNFDMLSLKYSMPDWIIELIKESTDIDNIEEVLKAFIDDDYLSVRLNDSISNIDVFIDSLKHRGIEVLKSTTCDRVIKIKGFDRISDLEFLNRKEAYIQDASSALAIQALDIKKDSIVFDVCAAPGGNSINVLDVLSGRGSLYSFDISDIKVEKLKSNISMYSRYTNFIINKADAGVYNEEYLGKADFIVADLPCSGLGIIGKKADIKLNITEDISKELADVQLNILNNVSRYLKKGGKLLFSTCTISHYENTDNVYRFLAANSNFSICDFSSKVPEKFKEKAKKGYLQLVPGRDDCDGFFISIFEKTND